MVNSEMPPIRPRARPSFSSLESLGSKPAYALLPSLPFQRGIEEDDENEGRGRFLVGIRISPAICSFRRRGDASGFEP